MGSANVELVRSIYAAWERGDFHSTDWAHPEIEYVFADGPAPGTWTGLSELADSARHALRGWAEYRALADEYRELDGERVLVLTRRSGRGKTSGLELDELQTRGASVFHVCDGKVARLIHYYDRDRAFTALGLAPEGETP
jgi:ketosteroid isomerase-like protein